MLLDFAIDSALFVGPRVSKYVFNLYRDQRAVSFGPDILRGLETILLPLKSDSVNTINQ